MLDAATACPAFQDVFVAQSAEANAVDSPSSPLTYSSEQLLATASRALRVLLSYSGPLQHSQLRLKVLGIADNSECRCEK